MKYIFTTILFLLPLFSNETKIKILVMKEPLVNPLLYTVMWNEGSVVTQRELRVILDCIKNRVKHEDFPHQLDPVLNQSFAFQTKKTIVPNHFKKTIDSLWKLPIKYKYLYFRSNGYSESNWMTKRIWFKSKKFKHEFS